MSESFEFIFDYSLFDEIEFSDIPQETIFSSQNENIRINDQTETENYYKKIYIVNDQETINIDNVNYVKEKYELYEDKSIIDRDVMIRENFINTLKIKRKQEEDNNQKLIDIENKKYILTINLNDIIFTTDSRSILQCEELLDIMSKNNMDFLNTIAGVSKFHRDYALKKMSKTNLYVYNPYINHKIYIKEFNDDINNEETVKLIKSKIETCVNKMTNITYFHKSNYILCVNGGRIPLIDLSIIINEYKPYEIIFEGNRKYYKNSIYLYSNIIYNKCSFFPYYSNNITFKNCHLKSDCLKMLNEMEYIDLIFYRCKIDIDRLKLYSSYLVFYECDINDETIRKFRGSSIRKLILVNCNKISNIACLDVSEVIVNSMYMVTIQKKNYTKIHVDLGINFCDKISILYNLTNSYLHCKFSNDLSLITFPYELYTKDIISDEFEEYVLAPNDNYQDWNDTFIVR